MIFAIRHWFRHTFQWYTLTPREKIFFSVNAFLTVALFFNIKRIIREHHNPVSTVLSNTQQWEYWQAKWGAHLSEHQCGIMRGVMENLEERKPIEWAVAELQDAGYKVDIELPKRKK